MVTGVLRAVYRWTYFASARPIYRGLKGGKVRKKVRKKERNTNSHAAAPQDPPALPASHAGVTTPPHPTVSTSTNTAPHRTAPQLIFVILVLALSGALVQQQDRGGSPTRINYSIFVAAFAAVTHLYLFPATIVSRIASPLFMALLDFVNAVLFLCAGIAVAAQLGGRRCTDAVCDLDLPVIVVGFADTPRGGL